jgi:hypothetical protein
MEPEVLINVSLRFPQLDRASLAEHLAPLTWPRSRPAGSPPT